MTEEIGEILLDDLEEANIPKKKEANKRFILPCLPEMYWFFYRKPWYVLLFIPPFVSSWINTYTTLTMTNILDSIRQPNAEELIKKLAFMHFIFTCANAVIQFLDNYGWTFARSRLGGDMKKYIFDAFMKKDVEFFDNHSLGDLLSVLNEDTGTVLGVFSFTKIMQIRSIGTLLTSLIVCFTIDWRLAILAIGSVGLVSYVAQLLKNPARKQLDEGRKAGARSLTVAEEILSNIRVVYSFNRQREEIERYNIEVTENADRSTIGMMLLMVGIQMSELLEWGTIALCLNIGCYFIMRGEITAGNLFALTKVAFSIGRSISTIFATMTHEQKGIESAKRIFEVVDEASSVPMDEGRIIENFKGEIELDRVWFKYPTRDTWVMKDVSMKINPGEIVAFVGHSGSGKSTLTQLLMRFYDVTQGTIRIDGVDIRELDPRWIHRNIGLVAQESILFATSIRDNVIYGLEDQENVTDEEVLRVLELSHAKHFIEKLPNGINTLIGEKGATLSGGQRQRVAIARTLIRNPVVMMTDEATSALDTESEKKVQMALDEVMKGRTSIIIAHRLGTIRAASKIFVFESGQLIEEGSHDELVAKKGVFYTLMQRQMDLHGSVE